VSGPAQAGYRFLPWVRRGAAAQVTTVDVPASGGVRVSMPVAVQFNHLADLSGSTTLELHGPGDVTGFDGRMVSRLSPPAQTLDAETNYFPAIEFDQVDLPWRYTPRKEDGDGRVRPWLCLLTFRESELGAFMPSGVDRPLESVTVRPGAPLPSSDQLWAWAHVQISGIDATSTTDAVRLHPERCLARLLSPRRLDARTTYWSLLVPAFEVGRRAGLRMPLTGATATLAAAWSTTTVGPAGLELPIYHRWRFGTGAGGDFESLARRLTPRTLPITAGTRGLDVSEPGGGLPAAAATPLRLGGALKRPTLSGEPPLPSPTSTFVTALATLVNTPATVLESGGTPVVAPPLYGGWHARRPKLVPASTPPWFHALNGDPRSRIAAALGTEVVQRAQHDLMASAWDQVAGIREANAQLRMAQVARAAGERLWRRHIKAAPVEDVLVLTAAVQGQVRPATRTVRNLVDHSPPHAALLSAPMRRLMRPLGPLGRRQARADRTSTPFIGRVNDGTYVDAVRPTRPALHPDVPTVSWLETAIGQALPTAAQVASAGPLDKGLVWDPLDGEPPKAWPQGPDKNHDSPSVGAFRAAASALLGRAGTTAPGATVRRLDLPALRAAVETAIDPRLAIPAGFGPRLVTAAGFSWSPNDPIEPVMAHPVFPQPMYKPLAELSPDWMLPGLFEIPADTATLAETNPAFIEAYMVGLNHEMSRELLWNEYPSDQRGSYFRQFWDPAGLVALPVPDAAKDIVPIHTWQGGLGTHSPRPTSSDLVLVVRGELLRRYPNTLVYAQRAQKADSKYSLVAGAALQPVFAGRLRPDVAFFGFALKPAEVRGSDTELDPGWFFVFQEQPGEPRFGLDVADYKSIVPPPAAWGDVAWSHLAPTEAALSALHYLDLGVTVPALRSLEVANGAGWHLAPAGAGLPYARGADQAVITCQQPVRVALHAAQLLA